MKLRQELTDFSFLLENDKDFAASENAAQKILHAIDSNFANTSSVLPRGMTLADQWIAKNGNPLADFEAALSLVKLIDSWGVVHTGSDLKTNGFHATVWFQGESNQAVSYSVPAAIVAAAIGHRLAVEEKI